MNRIELKSRLVDAECFQAKALGLIQEFALRPGVDTAYREANGGVVCYDHSNSFESLARSLTDLEQNRFAAICISSRSLLDVRVCDVLRSKQPSRKIPLMIELRSDDLLLLDDDQEFDLLNLCEEMSATVHLELDDYRENWSEQIRQALVRLSGFVGSLGLPVPEFSPKMDEERLKRIEAELDALLTSVSRNFDISILSFRNHRVGFTGTIESQRFWHGL